MRKIFLFLMLTVFVVANSFTYSQNRIALQKATEIVSATQATYRIDPQPLLQKFYEKIGFDPAKVEVNNTLHKAAWNFQVGTPVTWKAINFSTNNIDPISSTCRAVGNNCYIFVEDAIWGTAVNDAATTAVKEAFDSKTPAGSINTSKGIFQNNVDVFGNPPDVDGDPKIIILILDIKDSFSGPGSGYVAGYFSSLNEDKFSANSNKAEIYFLDGVQNSLTGTGGLNEAMSTTAHEFQHMIHWNYITSATTFFNECWSLSAEIINGYGIYSQSRYVNESNQYLLTWRSGLDESLNDYSRAARFGLYLYEQFGASIFGNYLQGKRDGISGLNTTLYNMGSTRTFATILPDWFLANYVNDKNVKAEWGYDYPNLIQMASRLHANPNVTNSDKIYNHAVQYISFASGKNLTINFDNKNNSKIYVKAFKYGQGSPVVEDVTLKTDYSVPDFGTTYSKVIFALYMVDTSPLTSSGPYDYSYSATGIYENKPQEIAYDTKEPVGVYGLSVGDTVAVVFNGIAGTKLDSIRVAVRNTAQMEGGVWRAGTNYFTGKRLAGPFMIAGKTTPVYDTTKHSYPVPYPNWVTVDLRSNNIDASSNFIAEFVINGVYENSASPYNRVMHTTILGDSPYHSYTYLNKPSGGSEPGWFFIGDTQTSTISLYLIRAYVTNTTTDAKEVIELLPSTYSLDQNYPNPFNPSTIISYNLPKAGNVQIKIFDALGREVRSLINEEKASGKYNIAWDGRDNYGSRASSGIYFYTISANDFVQTKKMLLIK